LKQSPAGIAVGVDGIFIETHFDPANAKSDGANMLHIDYFEALMTKLVAIRKRLTRFNFYIFYIFTLKNFFIRSIPNIL
jgi:3-deoxy-D-manno-octulosonic acid (KDO) 8-phosphate synthase